MTRRVTWRGVQVDERTAAMLDELAAITGRITIQPSQGSWSGAAASAGTHTGCGAVDLMNNTPAQMDTVVRLARSIGFAAWHRTPAQSNWPHHVHLIAVQPGGKHDRGCLSSSAANQVVDYYNGLNGLAGRGRDDATRAHVGVTWETYNATTPTPGDPIGELGMLIAHTQHDRNQKVLVGPTSARIIDKATAANLVKLGVKDTGGVITDSSIRDLSDTGSAAGGVAKPGVDRKMGDG